LKDFSTHKMFATLTFYLDDSLRSLIWRNDNRRSFTFLYRICSEYYLLSFRPSERSECVEKSPNVVMLQCYLRQHIGERLFPYVISTETKRSAVKWRNLSNALSFKKYKFLEETAMKVIDCRFSFLFFE